LPFVFAAHFLPGATNATALWVTAAPSCSASAYPMQAAGLPQNWWPRSVRPSLLPLSGSLLWPVSLLFPLPLYLPMSSC
jgi:hypothetical protein